MVGNESKPVVRSQCIAAKYNPISESSPSDTRMRNKRTSRARCMYFDDRFFDAFAYLINISIATIRDIIIFNGLVVVKWLHDGLEKQLFHEIGFLILSSVPDIK